MGQYYRVALNNKGYKMELNTISGEKDWIGQKLLEFMYLDNPMIVTLGEKMLKEPIRLAIVGDYADDIYIYDFKEEEVEFLTNKYKTDKTYYKLAKVAKIEGLETVKQDIFKNITLTEEEIDNLLKITWEEGAELGELEKSISKTIKWHELFFINHDKKEYIDINEYIKKSTSKDDWTISPFIMTALGNGQGGGDYIGYNEKPFPNFYEIGRWANDLVSLNKERPEGYKELKVYFKKEIEKHEN